MSSPSPGSRELHFPTRFPQGGWEQFKACLWKQHLSYWRSPSYNLMRIIFMFVSSLVFGVLFWKQGEKMLVSTIVFMSACIHYLNFYDMKLDWAIIDEGTYLTICFCFGRKNQQDLFNVLGSMFTAIIFFGINNCSTVLPLVATERTVLCRERFAGMYSSWAYSLAQVQNYCDN